MYTYVGPDSETVLQTVNQQGLESRSVSGTTETIDSSQPHPLEGRGYRGRPGVRDDESVLDTHHNRRGELPALSSVSTGKEDGRLSGTSPSGNRRG